MREPQFVGQTTSSVPTLFLCSSSIISLNNLPAAGTTGVNVHVLTINNINSMRNVYNFSLRAWLLSLLCLLVGGRAAADEVRYPIPTDDYITVDDVTLVPGSTDMYEVKVNLQGSRIYTAYQMDILFPPGVDVVVDEDGPYVEIWEGDGCIYPYTRKKLTHGITSSYGVIGPKTLRLSCISDRNAELTAQSGPLLSIMVKVSPYLKPGDVTLKVTNLDFITKENAQEYSCKDQTLTLHAEAQSTVSVSVSGDSHYSTCVLPFAVDKLPDGLKAYSAHRMDDAGSYVLLDEVQSLAAYTPYILYADHGYSGTLSGSVDASLYQEVVSDGYLRGAIVAQQQSQGYVLQDQGDGAQFYAMNGTTFNIPEGKCWLQPDQPQSAPALGIQVGGTTTAITTPTAAPATTPIYTLDGVRVSDMQPGRIYVVAGHKVLKLK